MSKSKEKDEEEEIKIREKEDMIRILKLDASVLNERVSDDTSQQLKISLVDSPGVPLDCIASVTFLIDRSIQLLSSTGLKRMQSDIMYLNTSVLAIYKFHRLRSLQK